MIDTNDLYILVIATCVIIYFRMVSMIIQAITPVGYELSFIVALGSIALLFLYYSETGLGALAKTKPKPPAIKDDEKK